MAQAETEARRAANRLRRALEKTRREVDALEGALRRAEGDDFPTHAYEEARGSIDQLVEFVGGCGVFGGRPPPPPPSTRSWWPAASSPDACGGPRHGMDERVPSP